MKSVVSVKYRAVPEEVKIVNKIQVVSCAGVLEPGAQAEESGETLSTARESRYGPANEDRLATAFQKAEETLKILFSQLRLSPGRVVCASMNYHTAYGGWDD